MSREMQAELQRIRRLPRTKLSPVLDPWQSGGDQKTVATPFLVQRLVKYARV